MPPKKDAFADLFQSASNTTPRATNLPLSQRQGATPSPVNNVLVPKKPATPDLDPFAIFDSKPSQSNNASVNKPAPVNRPVPVQSPLSNSLDGTSLLDDEFTDVFTPPPQPKQQTPPVPVTRQERKQEIPRQATGNRKDSVLAELLDIGFTIDDSNEAINKMGPNIQACVNYIMNKNSSSESNGSRTNSRSDLHANEGIDFNQLGQSLFSNANKLFNKSKKTVMKNLEQFQAGSSASSQSSVPEWMKTQEKYKSDALEKKIGLGQDHEELDYGSDSENFNQDEVATFMRLQKEKEKERAKQRYNNIRESTLNKVRGMGSAESSPRQGSSPRPEIPALSRGNSSLRIPEPPKPKSVSKLQSPENNIDVFDNDYSSNLSQSHTPIQHKVEPHRPASTPKSASPRPVLNSKPIASPPPIVAPKQEEDLLGMFQSASISSSLRVKDPLNQFDETDYTTAKAAAQEAFKSGNYASALESYLICLSRLPTKHESRVVIQSNLAVVYKQLGELNKSLESVEDGLGLIAKEEVQNTKVVISEKNIKYWYTKLVKIKAESLELMEKYELSLESYNILIKDLGVVDKKVLDGKRRVDKIVNPQNHRPKVSTPRPLERPTVSKPKQVSQTVEEEQVDGLEQDKINQRLQTWAQSRPNLRNLLIELDEIIPTKIAMKPALRHLTLNELMLPKQVKIQYMKVISSIHPDKLASQCKGDKISELVCNGVFIILNKSWDEFKVENSL